jgi:hypothetical protein
MFVGMYVCRSGLIMNIPLILGLLLVARYGHPSKADEQSQRSLAERLQKRQQVHALAHRYKDPGWAVARL